jgi:hypothetical protein
MKVKEEDKITKTTLLKKRERSIPKIIDKRRNKW